MLPIEAILSISPHLFALLSGPDFLLIIVNKHVGYGRNAIKVRYITEDDCTANRGSEHLPSYTSLQLDPHLQAHTGCRTCPREVQGQRLRRREGGGGDLCRVVRPLAGQSSPCPPRCRRVEAAAHAAETFEPSCGPPYY